MPPLPAPRRGDILRIQERQVPFTFWPTRETGGRRGVQTQIFTNDPWGVIFSSINKMPYSNAKLSAISFLEQARDYFRSADSASLTAAKPVLVYYSILNLTKALLLKRVVKTSLDVAKHGLREKNAGIADLNQHELRAYPSNTDTVNLFDELLTLFRGNGLSNNTDIKIADLMPQTIIGHRMWCDAATQKEKFLPLARLEYCDCKDTKEIYLRLFFYRDDLNRLDITHSSLLVDSRLKQHFREVQNPYSGEERPTICFESITTSNYHGWPSDKLLELSQTIKDRLWMILLNAPPYRRYYVYLCPLGCDYLIQLPTIYALAFYFSSITRYRPIQFRKMIESKYGGYIQEFANFQIYQFVYLMASEFANRDIIKPSVI